MFAVGQSSGVWGTAVDLPGISGIGNSDNPARISCSHAGPRGVAGSYYDGSNAQAFVTAP